MCTYLPFFSSFSQHSTESRRDQEEGGERDSHEEASPEEIKSREVVLGYRESWTSFASVVSQRRSNGHCLCDSVLHSSWDSNCVVLWSLRNAGRTLPYHPVVLAAVHGSLGLSGWLLFRGFTLLSPFSHSSPSLIGLLASVDVKEQIFSGYRVVYVVCTFVVTTLLPFEDRQDKLSLNSWRRSDIYGVTCLGSMRAGLA